MSTWRTTVASEMDLTKIVTTEEKSRKTIQITDSMNELKINILQQHQPKTVNKAPDIICKKLKKKQNTKNN